MGLSLDALRDTPVLRMTLFASDRTTTAIKTERILRDCRPSVCMVRAVHFWCIF